MVTTMISEAVPITMPSVVSAKRTLLMRNESTAMLTISLNSIVRRAVPANGLTDIVLLYELPARRYAAIVRDPSTSWMAGRSLLLPNLLFLLVQVLQPVFQ